MTEGKDSVRTEIRHLYKNEPQRKAWRDFESRLASLTRKLTGEEKISVYVYAERLALNRINRRLEKKRLASREVCHG